MVISKRLVTSAKVIKINSGMPHPEPGMPKIGPRIPNPELNVSEIGLTFPHPGPNFPEIGLTFSYPALSREGSPNSRWN